MRNIFLMLIGCCLSLATTAQQHNIVFRSSDPALEQAFNWAKTMALSYKGRPGDPVGPWYESALPPRSAFCMRDVAHQSIGGEILGLTKENKNMLGLFVQHISEGKNWCSYWEMNRDGQPAPEDYRNDREFWYNLNANFDILHACWRMYLWTGDTDYINLPVFARFHEKSVEQYIDAWVLQPDSLLTRPLHPNAPVPFNSKDAFHRCRGLPSYSEGVPGLKMGVDLVAALYRGLWTYADIMQWKGEHKKAVQYRRRAEQYRNHLDTHWWDATAGAYHTHVTGNGTFGKGEGATFLLWFDALRDQERTEKTIRQLTAGKWNVENLSYFPYVLSKFGYPDKAYQYILYLSDDATSRREYPEVSFGVIEGIVQGLMGIDADARYNRISTLYAGVNVDSMTVEELPVLGTSVSVGHGKKFSWIKNNGTTAFTWRVKFEGTHKFVTAAGKRYRAGREQNRRGQTLSFADITITPGSLVKAAVD